MQKKAVIIGAGIVGLATARALSIKGYSVTVIERTDKAVGASIRNFGMVWPIGQPDGALYQRALRSREIWKETADSAGLWYHECGSLHLAYEPDEWQVLRELFDVFQSSGRPVELLTPEDITKRFRGIHPVSLLGGLFSETEMIVDPRQAIAGIPSYLEEFLNVSFIWGKQVSRVEPHKVYTDETTYEADLICVCSGADFESLYPSLFASLPITKCKLQMMRFAPADPEWRIGTSVCGGLSLIHYKSFLAAASLPGLKERYTREMPGYLSQGIHVMVSQNHLGELTVGDSHEYGNTFDPFDRAEINDQIRKYLGRFMKTADWQPLQSWNGVYAKMKNGETEIVMEAEPGVYIVNGLGGAGMTLSFGLAEEFAADL
jgi:FAD dependent oxidoreductase TIGR03364